jgi:hypothetical protein
MPDLPKTTTTGNPDRDVRKPGDGAVDQRSAQVHHAEDDVLIGHAMGLIPAWRARLRRRRQGRPVR